MSSVALFFGLTAAPVVATANVVATVAAYSHITGFWRSKPEVPFVTGFNEGIRKSNDLRSLLIFLAVGWAFTGLAGLLTA